jgi:hypothetical protein
MDILNKLESIINEELESDKQLISLCEKDSRLGFHSEAEGYKYFPEKIRWRMQQLKHVLTNDLPEIKSLINQDKWLFPEYTGIEPEGAVAFASTIKNSSFTAAEIGNIKASQWQTFNNGTKTESQWTAAYNNDSLYFIVSEPSITDQDKKQIPLFGITVKIEPRRLWPCARFDFNMREAGQKGNKIQLLENSGKRYFITCIPFKSFWWREEKLHPLRVDVRLQSNGKGTSAWCPDHPLTPRLIFETDNPADLGWLILQ